jgi:hypothetical protein
MIFWCILIIICSISHGQLETNIFMVRIRPRIHDLTMNADKQWSAIKVTKDTMPQVGIHLVGMVLHSLVVAILLLQIVAFIPNLFTKHLPHGAWLQRSQVARATSINSSSSFVSSSELDSPSNLELSLELSSTSLEVTAAHREQSGLVLRDGRIIDIANKSRVMQ